MTTKRRKFFAIAVLTIIGGVVAYGLLNGKDEPKYQGRYLSEWLEEYEKGAALAKFTKGTETAMRKNAVAAVGSIGTNGLPYLMKWIAHEPPAWRMNLARVLPKRTRRLLIRDALLAERAQLGFALLGTNASSVIPELEALLKSGAQMGSARRASYALGGIGAPAVPVLKAALADPNQPNRDRIIFAFETMADRYGTNLCLPILMEARNDADMKVRSAATNALKNLDQFGIPGN